MSSVQFGDDSGLCIRGSWHDDEPFGNAADRTRGTFCFSVLDRPVWGGAADGVDWIWIELAEHLSWTWTRLLWEEDYPQPLQPRTPAELEKDLEALGERLSTAAFNDLADKVDDFVQSHDLASAFGGLNLSPFRLLPEGDGIIVATSLRQDYLEKAATIGTLESFANAVVSRLASAEDERSVAVSSEWRNRNSGDVEPVVLFTGWPIEDLERIVEKPSLERWSSRQFQPNEFLAAARLAGRSLEWEELSKWLERINEIEKFETPRLDKLSAQLEPFVHGVSDLRPWEQGDRLAREVRADLPGGSGAEYFAVDNCLRGLGVLVDDIDLPGPEELDALAVWGDHHGPAILVNRRGIHARHPGGRRATLAHELGHLLIDRRMSLPQADVVGGRAPRRVEARANAFAAEILLPESAILIAATDGPLDKDRCERLFSEFGTSYQLGAQKVTNVATQNNLPFAPGTERHLRRWRDRDYVERTMDE